MPRVTCILPAYNAAPSIAQAVESILRQTERDFLLLIMDDGSSDNTLEIAERYTGDSRVQLVVNEENLGLAAICNKGIALSDSAYIARMDSDDIAYPERFSRQIAYMESHPQVGLCGARREDVHSDGRRKVPRATTDPDSIEAALFWDTLINHPTFFIDRERLEATGVRYDPSFHAAQDYEFLCRLHPHMTFGNVKQVLLRYRIHPHSMSKSEESVSEVEIVRRRNLDELLDGADEDAHMLNLSLRLGTCVVDAAELRAFLMRLLAANAERRRYPDVAFAGVLGGRLLRLIKRRRATHLHGVYADLCREAGLSFSPLLRMRLGLQGIARPGNPKRAS